ncbi:hypothetical protein C8R45DRAFT_932027 [Mycena sanguinolenta]|nr:hypothetical protein C8R45DRAFT_932027 [Mycena sanguinolenta]
MTACLRILRRVWVEPPWLGEYLTLAAEFQESFRNRQSVPAKTEKKDLGGRSRDCQSSAWQSYENTPFRPPAWNLDIFISRVYLKENCAVDPDHWKTETDRINFGDNCIKRYGSFEQLFFHFGDSASGGDRVATQKTQRSKISDESSANSLKTGLAVNIGLIIIVALVTESTEFHERQTLGKGVSTVVAVAPPMEMAGNRKPYFTALRPLANLVRIHG